MNIYFSGIGGVGLGPLADIALDAGHTVLGSDSAESPMTIHLASRGVVVSHDQSGESLKATHAQKPIDWFVYTSGLADGHPELQTATSLDIAKITKRDELLNAIIQEKGLKLLAVAGTHGKTTTTGMIVWTMLQLGIPVSYSIGTTVSFGPSGRFDPASEYFVYECDEYDRNFLQFHPAVSIIPSIDYDHSETYGTPDDYMAAFHQFLEQSQYNILWQSEASILGTNNRAIILTNNDIVKTTLIGEHNRRNATLAAKLMEVLRITGDITGVLNRFPGVNRRFEQLAPHLYSDYGHHPVEIAATLQLAREVSNDIVLVYQPHQNVRQHELRRYYEDCFVLANDVYWLPTYLTREDPDLPVLTPEELTSDISNHDAIHFADMNNELWQNIQKARERGALVLCMGAGTIDEWVRSQLSDIAKTN